MQKAGGAFTLTADADFGASFGLKSIYYKSRGTVSSAGVLRLGNAESVGWRNAANGADKLLKVNASDKLEFDGSLVGLLAGALTASKAVITDASGNLTTATTTSTQIGYLSAATGTTGTASTNLVFSTSPTLVTPVLGAATATSINGLTITSSTGTLTVTNGKTAAISNTLTFTGTDSSSVAFGAGGTVAYTGATLAQFAPTTSAQLAGVISDETGSGALVFATTPTLVTPVLGVATATSINKMAITAPATSSTLAVADGKTFTASNTLTLAGTDGNTMTFPSGSSTVMTLASADTITGVKTFGTTKLAAVDVVVSGSTLAFPAAADTLMGKATTDVMTNKTATAMGVTAGSYINMLTQAAIRFNDDSGGDYVALQAPTGVTTHTLKLPASQGAASSVLTNDGSGNLTWGAALTTSLNQFNTFLGNASNVAAATNTSLLGDIKGTTASTTVTMTIAAPGVVTHTSHGLATGDKIYLTTTGALPTGLTASTTYYIVKIDANSYSLSTTLANAVAGTKITTSGSQSGVHTALSGGFVLTSGVKGVVDTPSPVTGYVGEVITINRAYGSATPVTTGSAGFVCTTTSVTLTPGDWTVAGSIGAELTTGSALTEFRAYITTSGAGADPGATVIDNPTSGQISKVHNMTLTGSNAAFSVTIPTYQVTVAAGTTVVLYPTIKLTFGSGTAKTWGWFQARRMT